MRDTPLYRPAFRVGNIFILLLPVFFALPFESSAQPSDQQEKAAKHVRDSILSGLYELLYTSDYTTVHTKAVKLLHAHKNDPLYVVSINFLLGEIELNTGNKTGALEYYRKADGIARRKGPIGYRSSMAVSAQKFANLYFEMQRYDSAYYYAAIAVDSSKAYRPDIHEFMRSRNLPIIGYHYFLQKDYRHAAATYAEVIAINEKRGAVRESANSYIKLADIRLAQSDYKGAVAMSEKALRIGEAYDVTPYKLAAVNKLIDIHRQSGNFKEVAHYLQLKMDLMDSIELADQKKQLAELEARFQSTLKTQENNSLKAINKKQEVQNSFLWAIVLLATLAGLLILVFAVVFFRQKRRISRQKADVDRLNVLNQKIFSVISHDFKGPMMGLDMLLGMQEKQQMDNERFIRQTGQLRSDLKQANLILENLLSWSKTELSPLETGSSTCSAHEVAAIVKDQLSTLVTQKKLVIKSDIPEDLVLSVPSDMLTIIFRNLLSNSIKYSNDGAVILIGYDATSKELFVRDHGIGMEQERLDQLFGQQLDSRLGTRHESGYGIGLHLVSELIRKHKGSIRAESRSGAGTTVYFTFNPVMHVS